MSPRTADKVKYLPTFCARLPTTAETSASRDRGKPVQLRDALTKVIATFDCVV